MFHAKAGNVETHTPPRSLILALFFLSGACGLIYETAWLRMLGTILGSSTPATSIVLASFMGGLALGSFIFGRLADKVNSPLFLYSLLEFGIGGAAFFMPLALSGLDNLYTNLYQWPTLGPYGVELTRFVLSFLLLLVPTTLIGGTLPVLSRAMTQSLDHLGRTIGKLYSANTAGAVVGCFASGLFLMIALGVTEATFLAGGINIAIAATVMLATRSEARCPTVIKRSEAARTSSSAEAGNEYSPHTARLVIGALAISGFCSLAYEVLWTRALVFYLDNTTHAFTIMLGTFLIGIALGGFIIGQIADRLRYRLLWFGILQILTGLLAALSLPMLSVLNATETPILPAGQWQRLAVEFGQSFLTMILPTILIGMALPLAGKIYTRSVGTVGNNLGKLYALNTAGGVVGSLVTGFLIIPSLGISNGLILIAGINTVLGITVANKEQIPVPKFKTTMISVPTTLNLILMSIIIMSGPILFISPMERTEIARVLYYREDPVATVKVYQDIFGYKTLSIDGFPVAGTTPRHQEAQKFLGHLPALLTTSFQPTSCVVGFGTGGTAQTLTRHQMAAIDCVELVPAVLNAADLFTEINQGVIQNPLVNISIEDGRNYLKVAQRNYDIISIDATSPRAAGSSRLYTTEFYQICLNRLSSDGILVQWLPFHLLSEPEVRMAAATFQNVFPESSLWFSPGRNYYFLVGAKQETRIDFALLQEKLEDASIRQDLATIGISDAYDLLCCYVLGPDGLTEYTRGTRLNSDNRPYLELAAQKAYSTMENAKQNLTTIAPLRDNPLPYLVNTGATPDEISKVEQELQARWDETQVRNFWPIFWPE